jgi:5-methylcytosine-specific restriction endonuclease McrA
MSQHSASGPEWERVKVRVWQRDNYVCVWCGVPLTADNSPTGRTVDHLMPVSKGGSSTDLTNLVSSCRSDNSSRGANELVRASGWNPRWLDHL